MGERKVLNKYIPADFDYRLIPKGKRDPFRSCEVRMMLPFSCQCNTCGEYMYRGKKFNSRKEDVFGEDYHGIKMLRFVIKCVACSSPITFKTDPENADYTCESGASRNFEAWKQNEADGKKEDKEKEEAEKGDAMKHLENRTIDSKKEMDIYDALDEMKAVNQRHEKVNTERLLEVTGEKHDSFVVQMSAASQLKDKEDMAADDDEARKAFERPSTTQLQRLEDPNSSDEERIAKKKRKKERKDGDGKKDKKKKKGDDDGKKDRKKKKLKKEEKKPEKHTFDVGNGSKGAQQTGVAEEKIVVEPKKKEMTLADLVAINVEKKKQEKKVLGGAVFVGIKKKALKKKTSGNNDADTKTKPTPKTASTKPPAGLLLASYSSSDSDEGGAKEKEMAVGGGKGKGAKTPSAALSLVSTYASSSDDGVEVD